MSLIVLTSASGSPGVSTTAIGLALVWPRPVLLVDADPTGGSAFLAGYFRAEPAPPEGLPELVLAARDGRLGELLPQTLLEVDGSRVRLLPGLRSHAQAAGVAGVWGPLLAQLRDLHSTGRT